MTTTKQTYLILSPRADIDFHSIENNRKNQQGGKEMFNAGDSEFLSD
jgi:hypothetical protein